MTDTSTTADASVAEAGSNVNESTSFSICQLNAAFMGATVNVWSGDGTVTHRRSENQLDRSNPQVREGDPSFFLLSLNHS